MRRFANGLAVLARDLADQEENWTRFVLVSAIPIRLDPRISCKTSLVFSTPHRPGALAHCLNVLDAHGLNLTKLESRPVPRHPWEYLFYADFVEAKAEDAPARDRDARGRMPVSEGGRLVPFSDDRLGTGRSTATFPLCLTFSSTLGMQVTSLLPATGS